MPAKSLILLRNLLTLAVGVTLALASLPFVRTAEAVSTSIVISEVYGGGGNSGATYTNDFIELYNLSGSPVNLTGWSVQYTTATGSGTWQVTSIVGTLAASTHYLIQEAAGGAGTPNLPTPEAIGTINLSATAGKVALVNTTTPLSGACPSGAQIIDLVGYGSAANCFEGTGPTPAPSTTTAAIRAGGGATDTDNNSTDFASGAPDPDNSSTDTAPSVTATVPLTGTFGVALSANVTITFSEAVDVTGAWFTLSCANSGGHTAAVSGGPTSYTLDLHVGFTAAELCTVTVASALVTDQDIDDLPDTMAADHVFSFTTLDPIVCGAAATGIYVVQGSGTASPLDGTSGVEIEGIVIGDYQNTTSEFGGFYLQDGVGDANTATSDGVFVFDDGFGVNVQLGDRVRVKGTVDESFGQTELNTITSVAVCSTGNPLPAAIVISLPVVDIAALEAWEGMRVAFPQELTVTETFTLGRYGEVWLSVNGRLYTPTNVVAPGQPAIDRQALNDRSRILLDDGNDLQNIDPTRYPFGGLSAGNTLREGDSVDNLTGVLDYRFGDYRLQPAGTITFTASNPRPVAPTAVGGELRVAAINVLNYFNGNGLGGGFPTARGASTLVEFNRQRAKVISAILGLEADVIGLMEIENDAPGNSAIEDLVAGLNAISGPNTYAFIDTGIVGTDAIRVALIYKPANATPVGDFALLTTAVDPRFIDTLNRPTLAQTFDAGGGRLTVAVNHLKSKGSDCNSVGDPDIGDGQGNCNVTRTNAALALVDWLAADPTDSSDDDFLVIGDMNAYALEDPIGVFTNATYSNLINLFAGAEAYSYVFDGQSGTLDHALANASLAAQVTGAAEWHINADEPTVLDYNVEFKTANHVNTLYAPDAYRASDHDPLLVGLNLNDAPAVSANGPYSVTEGANVNVSATGSGPNSEPLTYAWDLDNNGTYETPGQNASFSALTLDGPTTATIGVEAGDGGLTATAQTTVTVLNAAPAVGAPAIVPEPSRQFVSVSASSVFTDVAADAPFSCSVDYGDGTGVVGGTISTNTCLAPSHAYTLTGSYGVTVTVTDKDGGENGNAATHAVTAWTLYLPVIILGPASSSATAADSTAPVEAARLPARRVAEVWKSRVS